jgi:hypothetical protein
VIISGVLPGILVETGNLDAMAEWYNRIRLVSTLFFTESLQSLLLFNATISLIGGAGFGGVEFTVVFPTDQFSGGTLVMATLPGFF